jgi:copper chaperone CopZ
MPTIHLAISGMTSVHATRAVFTALSGVEGIVRAQVEMGRVEVEHDGRVTVRALEEAVRVAGYEVTAAREERRLPVL